MSKSSQAKQQFYAQPEIARTYDELRFGSSSGAWVNAREIEITLSLLPPFRRALDLGCGTGRLTQVLTERGTTVGVDTSGAMLAQACGRVKSPLVQGDAFVLPFADASFDLIVALRLVFHFAELDTLLREIARAIAPGGTIVFDTLLWSPRAWLPLDKTHWGGGVFAHEPAKIERVARQLGLQASGRKDCFLFSPYLYRRLPFQLVRALEQIEPHLSPRLRARAFWKFVRMD